MKKRNMATLALMGLASSFFVTGQLSATDDPRDEARNEESSEVVRGGCGAQCGGGSMNNRPSARDRRYGNPSQRDVDPQYPEQTSCAGNGCQGRENCSGGEHHCNGMPPRNGPSAQNQNLKYKRNNVTRS